jgi:DNA repair protein RadA/Sms
MAAKRSTADKPAYTCRECGWASTKWVGRCGECQAWNTVQESGRADVSAALAAAGVAGSVRRAARPIGEVEASETARRSTGIGEVDRVLGGGLVPGAVILLSGEPGVGKSTLLLRLAHAVAADGRRVLYVSGEESCGQVRMRADRMGALSDLLFLAAETDLSAVLAHIDAVDPELLIVDSVQTVSSGAVEGIAGGVSQVRTVAAVLTQVAKARGMGCLLVGHVTKDGSVAGPRTMEHVVDAVLTFEGDRHSALRLLRAVKNRFGAVDEVGCFELTEAGIVEILDPSGVFLTHRTEPISGTAVTVTLEGRRPLVAEVQALVAEAQTARRTTSGVDAARLAMIAAVLESGGLRMGGADLFAATVGGVRIAEPAADLALAMALATARTRTVLPLGVVVIGELGLAGDVRPVPALERRLREAARLGFRHAIVPADRSLRAGSGLRTTPVRSLREGLIAMADLRVDPAPGAAEAAWAARAGAAVTAG